MRAVDLHTHTTKSDGTYTPAELVRYAAEKNLRAIAITDHDTMDGVAEAIKEGEKFEDLEIIPGCEFSTEYNGKDIHIVGLYMDANSESIKKAFQKFIDAREKRNEEMCKRLKAKGIDIEYKDMLSRFEGSVITRAHFAAYMYEKGYIKSRKEAFDRFIGDRCDCFVPRHKISPEDAIGMVKSAGGIPILAHPILYGMSDGALRVLVGNLKAAGLVGIEAIYSTYTAADERQIRKIAKDFDLKISGGSDFHGENKKDIDLGTGMGHLFVPESVLDDLISDRK